MNRFGSAQEQRGPLDWRRYAQAMMLAMLVGMGIALNATPVLAETMPAVTLVNINTAAAEELSANLSGVGLAKARRIIEYREMYGPFEHIDELAEVAGIGAGTVDRNRARIVLE